MSRRLVCGRLRSNVIHGRGRPRDLLGFFKQKGFATFLTASAVSHMTHNGDDIVGRHEFPRLLVAQACVECLSNGLLPTMRDTQLPRYPVRKMDIARNPAVAWIDHAVGCTGEVGLPS